MFMSSSAYAPSDVNGQSNWLLDLNAASEATRWEVVDTTTNDPGFPANQSVYDPVTDKVYHVRHNQLISFDPQTKLNTYDATHGFEKANRTATIDPTRRIMVSIGDHNGDGAGHWWDLTNLNGGKQTFAGTGDNQLEFNGGSAPGFTYDSVSDKFVAWSGGADVYLLDWDTKVWTRQSPAPTSTVVPTQVTAEGGTFGRFQYVPSKNAFIAVNAADQNVYFYKLSSASAAARPNPPMNFTVK
jgi:hypothetical protein